MAKKKSAKKKGDYKRVCVQAVSLVLHSPHIGNFFSARLYQGAGKHVCVPGLFCYSCPGAVGACPIGALQASFTKGRPTFPYYVLGILLLFGLLLGRTICGFLCPFGFVQDLLYRIPFFRKIRTFRHEPWLRLLKVAVFVFLVVLLPLLYTNVPYFCKYLCPAGTLFGAIPILSVEQLLSDQIGPLFWWKLIVLIVLLLLSLMISRPFCRYLCPLGLLYGACNRVALVELTFDADACVYCGKCREVCPMGIDPVTAHRSIECIRCGRCRNVCPTNALHLGIGASRKVRQNKGRER